MLELGGVGYKSDASDPNAENNQINIKAVNGQEIQGNTGISSQKTWLEQAIERLGALHPYDTPAIAGWCCDATHPATEGWLGSFGAKH